MPFTFSIRTALTKSWNTYKKHWQFFAAMAAVVAVFNIVGNNNDNKHVWITVLVLIASMIWAYVWISVSFAAVDGKEDLLNFKQMHVHMPTFRNFLTVLALYICVGVIGALFLLPLVFLFVYALSSAHISIFIVLAAIAVMLAGAYLLTRSAFVLFSYVDRQGSVKQSFVHSWQLTTGKVWGPLYAVFSMEALLIIVGIIPFGVGLLVTYPLSMMLITYLYRALVAHRQPAVTE